MELLLEIARCPGDRYTLAGKLISEFGSLKSVLEAKPEQLAKINGLGPKSITMIRMIIPMIKRWERMAMQTGNQIKNTTDAKYFCRSIVSGLRHEQFHVICLNSRCVILGEKKVSDGSLCEVNAYPRVVLETALNYNAHSILLCHNHPGGTNSPSPEDIMATVTIQRLTNGVGIQLIDHIIVAGYDAYSMIEHGDISPIPR